jgi:hypothetical protein
MRGERSREVIFASVAEGSSIGVDLVEAGRMEIYEAFKVGEQSYVAMRPPAPESLGWISAIERASSHRRAKLVPTCQFDEVKP